MKKFCLSMVAIAGLMSASVYASNSYLDTYSTTLTPPKSTRAAALTTSSSTKYATDIKVINATNEFFILSLPNTSIYERVEAHAPNNDHVHNTSYVPGTAITLTNPRGVAFNLTGICPEAVITVYGFYNGGATIDTQDCY